ncbi:hypothetical protein ACFFU8_19285 [Chromobacterium piscinae]|uniref:hypothetical protein n=1 Tax=Chromobacterium piscinae TaxID=686831 RepID=UPI001E2E68E7|nr:hypothetical protein [Chromobacterium piscinae]MCD5328307.1 hypothetical protein [Chromobacterium piscinae]
MTPQQTLALRLTRNPDHGRAAPCASVNLPLLETPDYTRRHAYARANPAPVLVNHRQYYALLDRLVRQAWSGLGERCRLFVQLRLPAMDLALPASLLDARVTVGAGLQREAALRAGLDPAPVAWIAAERVRRDLWDAGDNTLRLAFWNAGQPDPAALLLPALDALAPRFLDLTDGGPAADATR